MGVLPFYQHQFPLTNTNLECVCSKAVTPSDCDKNKGGRDILGECHAGTV